MGNIAQRRELERTFWRDLSGNLVLATGDTTKTLAASKTGFTIFVQRIIVWITTSAAQSLAFQDTNGTPLVVADVTTAPGANTRWDFDYGDLGVALTEAKDFQVVPSAAGLGCNITFYAYLRPTSTLTANVAGVLGGVL